MSQNKVAIRYAKAVLQQAQESNQDNLVFDDMQSISGTIKNSRELQNVLKSPIFKAEDKKLALLKIFSNQSPLAQSLIKVLADNQRIGYLMHVANSYVNLYNDAHGIKVAKVTTAVPLSPELQQQVLAKVKELTGSGSVTLENEVDESLIGGFVLRVGDLQYNASISNQLNKLKRQFSLN